MHVIACVFLSIASITHILARAMHMHKQQASVCQGTHTSGLEKYCHAHNCMLRQLSRAGAKATLRPRLQARSDYENTSTK